MNNPLKRGDELDLEAWRCVDNWASCLGTGPEIAGLDHTDLIKWFLWDKVGACIRTRGESGERRRNRLSQFARGVEDLPRVAAAALRCIARSCKIPLRSLKPKTPHASESTSPARSGEMNRTVLAPFPTQRLQRSMDMLHRHGVRLVAASGAPTESQVQNMAVPLRTHAMSITDVLNAARLGRMIDIGLGQQGVDLDVSARRRLFKQLAQQQATIRHATFLCERTTPSAVLLHADNHSPYQEFAAVSRLHGVPTISFQHGLDCERYYLDRGYATHYAVWSQTRMEAYRNAGSRQPQNIVVTGNPAYDHKTYPREIIDCGNEWLLLTRPHRSRYCYAPSRYPHEGARILEAILDAMRSHPGAMLTIKPHPNDDLDLYFAVLKHHPLSPRVMIREEMASQLVPSARIIISEDTTAGVEAMFEGKVVVHAHFADSTPVLSLCEFGAALPGFDNAQLSDSLGRALALSHAEKAKMLRGQSDCLDHYAGRLDGKASMRFERFLLDAIHSG